MKRLFPDLAFSAAVFAGLLLLLLLKAPTLEHYFHDPDQGQQIGLGREVFFGKIPGVNGVAYFGPMVAFTSALGFWLSGSLLGETLICAGGYAAALWIIFFVTSRYTTRLAGLAATAFAYVLLARFYKWYLWFFPLALILLFHCYLHAPPDRRRRWVWLAGTLLGVEWLYRHDFGTTGVMASLALLAIFEGRGSWGSLRRFFANAACLIAAFSLPLLIWFGYLAHVGGLAACHDYLATTYSGSVSNLKAGTLGNVHGPIFPMPHFNRRMPLSPDSVLALSLMMVSLTSVIGMAIGLGAEIRGRCNARTRILLVVALFGLSTIHQAWYCCDGHHLLQVTPAAVIGAALLMCFFLDGPWFAGRPHAWNRVVRFVGLAYFATLFTCVLGMMPAGRNDQAELSLWPRARYAALAHPLTSRSEDPAAAAIAKIRELADCRQSMLVFPFNCQFYALADRRMSGIIYAYFPGIFQASPWSDRNFQAIQRDKPAVVVVRSDFFDPLPAQKDLEQLSREAHPDVDQWIRKNYTKIVFNEGRIMLLVPSQQPPTVSPHP